MTEPIPTAADNRRATALVCHYGHDNLEGVNEILTEANEAHRVIPLLISILDLHAQIVPTLLTADGLACLTQMVYSATERTEDQDYSRSLRLITTHSEEDAAGFIAVMDHANADGRFSEAIVGVLSIYRAYVPLLYSDLGLTVLGRSILDWAAREDATE